MYREVKAWAIPGGSEEQPTCLRCVCVCVCVCLCVCVCVCLCAVLDQSLLKLDFREAFLVSRSLSYDFR